MLPVATIEIPVIDRKSWVKPRMYDDEKPLPVKPSEHAPKNARIISRTVDDDGVAYNLKIGEVDISNVGVEEILEYVSALELEDFENREFEEERKVLRVIEAQEELMKEQKLERARLKARSRGTVAWETDTASNDESETPDEAVGKHGRARPTYTQFYLKPQPSGAHSKTHTETKVARDTGGESDSQSGRSGNGPQSAISSSTYPQQRRRRKRDPATGELIALETLASEYTDHRKRPRRRRHPITNELMPLGWRYDPNAPDEVQSGARSTAFKDLSISDERDAKRVKVRADLDSSRSPAPSSTKPSAKPASMPGNSENSRVTAIASPAKYPVVQILSSGDETDENLALKAAFRQTPKSPVAVRSNNFMLQSALQPSGTETSPEPEHVVSRVETAKLLSNPPSQTAKRSDVQGDDESEEEWFVEEIISHSWSDPKTHPTEFGKRPIMLYQVRWAGYETPTWEPVESFDDTSTVVEYRNRVGLDPTSDTQAKAPTSASSTSLKPNSRSLPAEPNSQPVERMDRTASDEAEYEVEGISAHHLSDPRTHPNNLWKKPVMLYKVKWKGYDAHTWEPEASFGGSGILRAYQKRHGLMH